MLFLFSCVYDKRALTVGAGDIDFTLVLWQAQNFFAFFAFNKFVRFTLAELVFLKHKFLPDISLES